MSQPVSINNNWTMTSEEHSEGRDRFCTWQDTAQHRETGPLIWGLLTSDVRDVVLEKERKFVKNKQN
jgi:hypothetical protein